MNEETFDMSACEAREQERARRRVRRENRIRDRRRGR